MSEFTRNIAAARAKGWHEGARRMEMERRMASALVIACLGRGFTVSVDNGEEIAVARSSTYRAVMDALWQTDEERVIVHQQDGAKVGSFYLIYGNDGYDLIADYSDNAVCNEIWENVLQPLSDRLCMA